MFHRLVVRGVAGVVVAGALVVGAPAWSAQGENPAVSLGLGAASFMTSVIYFPVKTLYALGGGMVGGLAWLFSGGDSSASQPILDAALRGDYVVTPSHLRGDERLEFVGRAPQPTPSAAGGAWDDSQWSNPSAPKSGTGSVPPTDPYWDEPR